MVLFCPVQHHLYHFFLKNLSSFEILVHNLTYKILVGKPEGKRPLGRPRRRWEDNIRMDLKELGWEGVDWMHLA